MFTIRRCALVLSLTWPAIGFAQASPDPRPDPRPPVEPKDRPVPKEPKPVPEPKPTEDAKPAPAEVLLGPKDPNQVGVNPSGKAPRSATRVQVDINTASIEQLLTLPGIHAATARRIVAARPFGSTKQLVSRRILTRDGYNQVKDLIVATKH